jgi:hypothetical protein
MVKIQELRTCGKHVSRKPSYYEQNTNKRWYTSARRNLHIAQATWYHVLRDGGAPSEQAKGGKWAADSEHPPFDVVKARDPAGTCTTRRETYDITPGPANPLASHQPLPTGLGTW